MTPVAELVVNVLPKVFPEMENEPFYSYFLPHDLESFETLPVFKVESVGETNGSFGSDVYHARNYRVQVMVFIDPTKTDIENLVDTLDRGLEANEYTQVYGEDRPHSENNKIHVLIRQYTTTRRK